MKTDEKKWYVVKTISGKEEKVKKYIQRELELNKMGKFVSQILIPTEKVYQIKNGKKINKERNFFPRCRITPLYLAYLIVVLKPPRLIYCRVD